MKGIPDLSFLLKIFLVYSATQINSRIVPQAKLTSFSHIFLISPFILLSSCHITFARTYAVDTVVKQWIWDIHVFIIVCCLVLVKIQS